MKYIDKRAIENLKVLQQKTGKDLVVRLSQLYIETTPQIILKIESLLEESNFEEIAREAHSLKSSSYNIGAAPLGKICETIERMVCEDEPQFDLKIRPLIKQMVETFEPTLSELRTFSSL